MRDSTLSIWFGLTSILFLSGCTERNVTARSRPEPVESASGTSLQKASWNNSARDGIPEIVKLRSFNDRESFRRWFTAIAELQFYQQSESWKTEQRDCAGLVRFAWREALRKHDLAWFRRMGAIYQPVASDVHTYDLEHGPLREKLFRNRAGPLEETDLTDGGFSDFADARTLKDFNCDFISRDRSQAEPGDLLYFYQPWVQKFPYHIMIFLGKPAQTETPGDGLGADWVVYHTGSSRDGAGLMKKVRLSVLDKHPDPRWRPTQTNRNFLGVYRLKILSGSAN